MTNGLGLLVYNAHAPSVVCALACSYHRGGVYRLRRVQAAGSELAVYRR